jgi:hypothetical protein
MRRALLAVILAAVVLGLSAAHSGAQCNPTCPGDFNLDNDVTVDEVVSAVNRMLGGCGGSPEQQGCIASGGTVSAASCCSTAPEFPDTCSIGSCGCAPQFSHDVSICECAEGACFDREQRACVAF